MKNILLGVLGAILIASLCLIAATEVHFFSFINFQGVHDAFEIFGAIATVAAVCIALYGFDSWKIQIGAESDHELARRAAVSLRRYKVAVVKAWHCADSSAVQIEQQSWIGDGGSDNFLVPIYEEKIKEVQLARADLESVALECSVIWGGVFDDGFEKLYAVDQKCCNCISTYLSLLIRGTADDRAFTTADVALEHWSEFKKHGIVSDSTIKSAFDAFSAPLESEIKGMLLKGRSR